MRTYPFMPSYGLPNIPHTGGTSLSSTGLSKPNMPWPGTGSTGPAFPNPNSVGTITRWGSTGSGVTGSLNTALGGTGTLSGGPGSTGLGGQGSSRTGLAQTGTSSLGGVGPGFTGFGGAGSSPTVIGNIGQSGAGMGKPVIGGAGVGSVGSSVPGFDISQGKPSRSGISLLTDISFAQSVLCLFS